MIRVLQYGLSDNSGGIENMSLLWFDNIEKDVVFDFVKDFDGKIFQEDYYIENGSKVFKITDRYKNPIKHFLELKSLIESGNYDYFHYNVMTLIEAGPAIICNSNKKCSCIYHCRSMYNNYKFPLKEILLQEITRIQLMGINYLRLACSREAGESMFGKNNFKVINNGTVYDRFRFNPKNRSEVRKQYGIKEDELVIGHVGNGKEEKNYPFIIESFSKAAKMNDRIKLMLIGNVDNDPNIRNSIKNYNIEDRVIITGVIPSAATYYSAMDLFFFPSLSEGFGNCMVEAQVSGLYCVASTAITEDVQITGNIIFIGLDDSENAANIILDKLNQKINREEIIPDEKYSIKHSAKMLHDFYESNLKQNN